MRQFSNYRATPPQPRRQHLPVGAYVARILDAKLEEIGSREHLVLQFDIFEGPNKDFFKLEWKKEDPNTRKWRGKFDLLVPKDDGSPNDEVTKKIFGNAMWAFEESNPGFRWNWDENALQTLLVGVVYRDAEYGGNDFTECGGLTSVQAVREGRAPKLKKRISRSGSGSHSVPNPFLAPAPSPAPGFGFQEVDDAETPF